MQNRPLRLVVLGLAIVCFGVSSGCGRSNPRIQGKVHFADGSPLTVGKVIAESSDQKIGASGLIRSDGTFELTTTATDGLPAGTWNVWIHAAELQAPALPDKPNLTPPTPLINARFTKMETSNLTFKVPEQLNWDITVEKP